MTLVFNATALKHGVTTKDIDCAMAVPLNEMQKGIFQIHSRGVVMSILTKEEAEALDELLTNTTPEVNPNVEGPFIKNYRQGLIRKEMAVTK